MVRLRNGSTVEDPRLDRLEQFDERSRDYPVLAALETPEKLLRPRSYTWRIQPKFVLNQGREGACVGFAVANELQARPAEVSFGDQRSAEVFAAREIYWPAQKIDPWDGGAYPGASPFYEGTSILAGVKIAQRLEYFKEYRWAFGLRDLVIGLGYNGPAVLGLNWYYGMYFTDEHGFITPYGQHIGGHAILARSVKLRFFRHNFNWWSRTWEDVDLDRSYVILRNSWGEGFGLKGDCKITLTNLAYLLDQRGEAVFFQHRTSSVS